MLSNLLSLFFCFISATSNANNVDRTVDDISVKSNSDKYIRILAKDVNSLEVHELPYIFQGDAYINAVLKRTTEKNSFRYTIIVPVIFTDSRTNKKYQMNWAFRQSSKVKYFQQDYQEILVEIEDLLIDIKQDLENNRLDYIIFQKDQLDNTDLYYIFERDYNISEILYQLFEHSKNPKTERMWQY